LKLLSRKENETFLVFRLWSWYSIIHFIDYCNTIVPVVQYFQQQKIKLLFYCVQRCSFHRRSHRRRSRCVSLCPLQGWQNPQRHLGRLLPYEPVRLDPWKSSRLHAREKASHIAALKAVASSQDILWVPE
jgi:hypothetical protein